MGLSGSEPEMIQTNPVDDDPVGAERRRSGQLRNGLRSGGTQRFHYRIAPRAGLFDSVDPKELLRYRDLLYFLVWRDVLVRYKQTLLGAAWALLQPLSAMVIFAVIFGRLAKLPSDNLPYPVFSYCALIIWTLFSQAVTQSSMSLIHNEKLVTKIYFPRVFIPVSCQLSYLLDFAIACCLLAVLLPYYGVGLSYNVWALPIIVALTMTVSIGAGLLISALNVKYRDFRYIVPFMTQIWMFASPVVYSANMIPEKWRLLYGLNPMAGAIEGFRWALVGTNSNPWPMVAVSTISAVGIFVLGLTYFQRTEDFLADLI